MKRLLIILLFSSLAYGIDTKLTGLTALTAVDNADLLYIIDDVAVTPTSKKITVLDLFDAIDTSAKLATILTNETGSGVAVFGTAPTFTTSITLGSTLITDVNVGNWNTAYTWGDHALSGYLTTYSETDPCHVAWLATNPLAGYLTAETDPCLVAWLATNPLSGFLTSYSENDPCLTAWLATNPLASFITSYSETDPCFLLSDVNDVNSVDISNWNTAYSWGDWSGEGFLTAEADPCFTAWLASDPIIQLEAGVEPNDLVMVYANSVLFQKLKHINITLISPADILCADMIPVWHNTSGYTFNIVEIQAWSNIDNVSLELEEIPSETDFSSPTQTQAVEIASNGTSCFYFDDTTPTAPIIETGHLLAIDFDTTDDPNYVKLTITGYYKD